MLNPNTEQDIPVVCPRFRIAFTTMNRHDDLSSQDPNAATGADVDDVIETSR